MIGTIKDKLAQKLGRRGGLATKKKRGKAHYSRMGKISSAKRWAKKTT